MYLTSMTHEELYAEVHKDLIEISTQANMFMDKVRKKTKNMLPYPLATQRITRYRRFKQWLYPNVGLQAP